MLNQLPFFVVTAEEENFHRAALRLHITQSALSRRIQQLESYLGVVLFDRQPRGVKLTAAGKALMADASQLLNQAKLIEEHVKQVARGAAGKVRIGISANAKFSMLTNFLQRLTKDYPALEWSITERNSQTLFRDLSEDRIDIAFAYNTPGRELQYQVDDEQITLNTHQLFEDRFMLLFPRKRAGEVGKSARLRDFRKETLLVSWKHLDHCVFSDIIRACGEAGIETKVFAEMSSPQHAIDLVSADLGISFVLDDALGNDLDEVMKIPLDDINYHVDFIAAWSPLNTSAALASMLVIISEDDRQLLGSRVLAEDLNT